MLVSLHLVFGQSHDCGIRSIGWFLELSKLDCFVASSYGSQHAVASQVEQLIGQFGQDEDQRLGQQMQKRKITLCEDETFHPQICLVAIEPVSNFLILEAYADNRNAVTWNACVDDALKPFCVDVIQCVSDQAAALLSHAQSHLGVHHSPDIFHVQYELSKATSLALKRQEQKARDDCDVAIAAHQENLEKCIAFDKTYPCTIRELESEKALNRESLELQKACQETRERFEAATDRKQRAREVRCGIANDYHPFELATGKPMESGDVQNRLNEHFKTLYLIAEQAKLSQGAHDRIAKAQRVLPSMIATIAFFWFTIKLFAERLECSEEVRLIWRDELVASYYIARVAQRQQKADEAKRLNKLSESILARARSPDRPFGKLPESLRKTLEQQAQQAADVFQRSSSCVEGRNGQLSLRHHGLRELTPSKLKALRTIHNYVIEREDGTTAAERFFGIKPRDLFGWLLEKLPMPSRPRKRRPQPDLN
jgi:Family of unknown function (DUF6399)